MRLFATLASSYALRIDRGLPVHRLVGLARAAAGLTAEHVAVALGISESSYRRLESGARTARRGELIAIAQITGQDLELFEGASSPNAAVASNVTPSASAVKASAPSQRKGSRALSRRLEKGARA
jgi:transcriptional regulator with XRE-family HTH domain